MGVDQKRMDEISKYLSKENLEKYLKVYSANYIATKLFAPEFTTDASTVIDRAKKLNINTHSSSSSRKLDNTQKIYKNTCQKKYGVNNISQANEIKEKKKQTNLKNWGVENVFQSEKIKQKSQETNLKKYGNPYPAHKSYKNKNITKPQQKVLKVLKSLKLDFVSEKRNIFRFKKSNGKYYSPIADFYVDKYKLVVEVYGDYWHANPLIYKDTDVFYTFKGKMTAKELQERDLERQQGIENLGYNFLIIWESEIDDAKSIIRKKIKEIKNSKNNENSKPGQ